MTGGRAPKQHLRITRLKAGLGGTVSGSILFGGWRFRGLADGGGLGCCYRGEAIPLFMRDVTIGIDDIYVPVKRRQTLDAARVQALAESILEIGQQTPIWVRRDEDRYVLVEGLHRLEACKTLGERTITAVLVQARRF